MNFIKTKFFFSFVFLVSAMLALGAVYWVGTQNDLKAIQILSYRKISFLQSSCSRYEHFVLGSDTKDLLSLSLNSADHRLLIFDLFLRKRNFESLKEISSFFRDLFYYVNPPSSRSGSLQFLHLKHSFIKRITR